LVGREQDATAVADLVRKDAVRLVTVTGPAVSGRPGWH
jgi:hypothetical protein